MPILEREPIIYPDNLLDELVHQDPERRWRLLYTKARQEKSLARDLLQAKIPFYLPLVPQDRLVRNRRVRSYLPIFTSYVFLYGVEDEQSRSKKTNRICAASLVEDQARLTKELTNIQRMVVADLPLTIESRLEPGERVRVKDGPFAGAEGEILRRKGKTILVVAATLLQQGVSVEIDDFLVEPLR
jgi:transcriptional antiterminator RfaH